MENSPLVQVFQATSYFEARLVEGILRGEGLNAVVPGEELADEFGMAQKMSGGASTVMVPELQREQAEQILSDWQAAAKQAREVGDQEADAD